MKVLQICPKPPFPPVDGGCIAIHAVTRGLLRAGHTVKVLAISTPKHPADFQKIPEQYARETRWETLFVDTSVKPLAAAKSILRGESYHVKRFFSEGFGEKIARVLQEESFDIIQLESIFVAPYIGIIRQHSQAKIVLRAHNVEHKIWGRMKAYKKNPLKRWILDVMIRQLKRYEMEVFRQVDGFLTVSEPDYHFFHELFPRLSGGVLPVGIDKEQYRDTGSHAPNAKPTLFHIGSMSWLPNLEGLDWFFHEVWNRILSRHPDLTFHLAGRGIPASWESLALRNVRLDGEVEDANQYMLSQDIMIVPLLSGSGVRIKIIEGMALGKTIITTSIGAEGLAVEHGKEILIANTPAEFDAAIDDLLRHPEKCLRIGEHAKNYVIANHDNEVITRHIISLYGSF